MSVHVIKSITRQIRERMGSAENAAIACGLSNKGKWSLYESEHHPETTLPLHRFLRVANAAEKAAIIRLLQTDNDAGPVNLTTEASETTEAAADLQRTVREAEADGVVTPLERQRIRDQALRVQNEAGHVLEGASR